MLPWQHISWNRRLVAVLCVIAVMGLAWSQAGKLSLKSSTVEASAPAAVPGAAVNVHKRTDKSVSNVSPAESHPTVTHGRNSMLNTPQTWREPVPRKNVIPKASRRNHSSVSYKKYTNRVPVRNLASTFLIQDPDKRVTTPTYEACEEHCIAHSDKCDIFIWMGNSPGFQDWRNRCTLRLSLHASWDPKSIQLEFQFDTYTGVREE
jgi:hypothetical protein